MLNSTETWKAVKELNCAYFISDCGRLKNANGRILKTFINNSGYECIKIVSKLHGNKHFCIHRLVAKYFIDNTNSIKTEVNHIDGNKLNNYVSNLEWVTSSGNKKHGIALHLYDAIFTMKNSLGKKHLPNPTSKYHNVTYDKARNKWAACIRSNGKNIGRKRFDTEEEAALWVNYLIDKYGFTDRPKNIVDKS